MTHLNRLKERTEKLNKFHQIEILKILQADDKCTINENNNGIFINLTSLPNKVIFELEKYLEYVEQQEIQLGEIEKQKNTLSNTFFKDNKDSVNILTGFIGSNTKDEVTTLGRNGSNYTASLVANYINAEELQIYTNVDGIYTANPELVADAKKIDRLSFNEANEIANFGATILHAKTIIPLVNN